MNPLRVAVIGAGHLGRIHAQKLRGLSGVSLTAVVDPDAESRAAVAAATGAPAFADARDCLDEFDAAVLAAPTVVHYEVAARLLAAGKHLLIEKPLAATGELAGAIVRMARERGVVVQVGHVERFNPAALAAWDGLGEPKYIEATRASNFSGRSTDIGVVLDVMIHDIDLVLAMVKSPVRHVQALGVSLLGEHEDVAQARLEFASGCVANLSASRVSSEQTRKMQVWSTAGFTTLDFAARTATRVQPTAVLRSGSFDAAKLPRQERVTLKDRLHTELLHVAPLPVTANDAITAELIEFAAAVREQRPPRVRAEDGHDAILVAEAILESILSHAWSGEADGPLGPQLAPPPRIIPAPHFDLRAAAREARVRKEAG